MRFLKLMWYCLILCVGPLPRMKMSFFCCLHTKKNSYLLQKIITFLQNALLLDNEKVPNLSDPILYPKYLHLLFLAFSVKSTAPNKALVGVKLSS